MTRPVVSVEDRNSSNHVITGLVESIARTKMMMRTLDERIADYEIRLAKHRLTSNGVAPCAKCNRLVPSPCHDSEGYHEGGPWDYSCREFFNGGPRD